MYEFGEFVDIIRESLQRELGEGCSVNNEMVVKNNGVELTGIVIRNRRDSVSPCIYAEHLFKDYLKGATIDEIIQGVKEQLADKNRPEIILSELMNYSAIKGKLYVQVINFEANQKMLEQAPHTKILDLAVVYRVNMEKQEDGNASIGVNNTLFSAWGVELEQLHEDAIANSSKLFPAWFGSLYGLAEQIDAVEEKGTCELPLLKILSNDIGVNGAAVMLYPGVLKRIADSFGEKKLLILPSSVNELFVLAHADHYNLEDLAHMVKEVNTTTIASEEVLSDQVYLYNSVTDTLEIAAA